MAEINLKAEEERKLIARRLRAVADKIERGTYTAESFEFEAEWNGPHATGKVFLNLAFWLRPIGTT